MATNTFTSIDDIIEEEKLNSNSKFCDKDDFPSMVAQLIHNIPWKFVFIIFITSIIVFSDVFIENILTNFSNTLETSVSPHPTNKGTIIQITFICIVYVICYLLIDNKK